MSNANGLASPILILTNERDFAADTVINCINERGVAVERWNTEGRPNIQWRPDACPVTADYRSVWLRQFLPEPTVTQSVPLVDDFLVAREQWRTWLADLAEYEPTRWMNPLWPSRRAENKLAQLRVASRVGLAVPRTLVTNNRADALLLQSEVGSCIVKAVASAYFPFSNSAFMFTTPLNDALALGDADWASQPVVVQQSIHPRTDVRIFIVGEFAAAASTQVDGPDWRLGSKDARWSPCTPPAPIIEGCRAYINAFGLAYGAFDFAIDDRTWWFLECNQAGEFAFADRPLKLGVADAIANWLIGDSS
ncbi:ATP-grasp ribosomal peptide maturase [Knoellia locipacati]|uniref:ATP-grasp ribosomal peptide maturase n=1 Tax=Knoellia locipacati TaxID=882824 RepID=A0A512SZX2_9MICO|nr:hypothetical protein [Knoellia locipacati]GEQ13526.1 ATP-grasp ribosomal peptide maturase [Knoellia locipacati]